MGIKLKNVKKHYVTGEITTKALDEVSVEIPTGAMVIILGPSGSGKSTMLNVISGLDSANSGVIEVDGVDISKYTEKQLIDFRREKLGFIFQQYNLLPNLTVRENVEVGAYLTNDPLDIDKMLETVGLKREIYKYPLQLSGGQQQRVSIARALAKNPSILFCDEPTGALDEQTGKEVLQQLQDLNEKMGKTIVIITHNPNLAKMADMVIKMNSGKIVETITNDTKQRAMDIDWG